MNFFHTDCMWIVWECEFDKLSHLSVLISTDILHYITLHYILLLYDAGLWHHITRHNMPIHNILSTAPQLSISQKTLGMLPENGNVMPKHVGATIHN
jgi:hypothetical protein